MQRRAPRDYYRRFTAEVFIDPGGHRLLHDMVGMDEAQFAPTWRAHVLGLQYG